MIDIATEIVPGKKANGYKYLKKDEWFLKCNVRKIPNMPGALQVGVNSDGSFNNSDFRWKSR